MEGTQRRREEGKESEGRGGRKEGRGEERIHLRKRNEKGKETKENREEGEGLRGEKETRKEEK